MYCWEVVEMMWRRKIFCCSHYKCLKRAEQNMRSSKCVACTPLLHVQLMSSSGSFCVKETIVVGGGGVERLLLPVSIIFSMQPVLLAQQASITDDDAGHVSSSIVESKQPRSNPFQLETSSSRFLLQSPSTKNSLLSKIIDAASIHLGLQRQPELSVEYTRIYDLPFTKLQKAVSVSVL